MLKSQVIAQNSGLKIVQRCDPNRPPLLKAVDAVREEVEPCKFFSLQFMCNIYDVVCFASNGIQVAFIIQNIVQYGFFSWLSAINWEHCGRSDWY